MLKVVFIAIFFFSTDISYVLKELDTRSELRKLADVKYVPSYEELPIFMELIQLETVHKVLMILNIMSQPKRHAWIVVVIDLITPNSLNLLMTIFI